MTHDVGVEELSLTAMSDPGRQPGDGHDESGPDATHVHYSLGTIGTPTSFNLVDEITPGEYESLNAAIAAIDRLTASFPYKLVERNYMDVQAIHQFVTITLSLGRDFATPDHRLLGEALMTSVVNWLSAMRLFLDHMETDLKRRFGKSSSEVGRFKEAAAAAFDARVGYRFTYKFRNYVQHCGLPLSHIRIGPRLDNTAQGTQAAELLLNRENLLTSYGEWGVVKADLCEMEPVFSLLPLAAEAMEGLRDIHRACTEIELDQALKANDEVVRAIRRIESLDAEGNPALFRYTGDLRGTLDITPRVIPAEAASKLSAVTSGSATRESLWSKQDERPPPRFDPATVRERFHHDSRGVQVLSAWFAEGGASPRFFRVVNKIIADDHGIQPLLTGLVNASVLLAHMTAGALGASAEGLVAGMLNIYGQFRSVGARIAISR